MPGRAAANRDIHQLRSTSPNEKSGQGRVFSWSIK